MKPNEKETLVEPEAKPAKLTKPLLVISAPSGAGKNTVIDALMQKRNDLQYSISSTTRAARGKEQNGIHYYFLSKQEFERRIENNLFLEWAKVLENYYGTEKSEIARIHKEQNIPILDIDVQGALQLKEKYQEKIISVFILPPSVEELRRRLLSRGTDSIESIEKRLLLAKQELEQKHKYDFQIINDELPNAVAELNAIVNSIL